MALFLAGSFEENAPRRQTFKKWSALFTRPFRRSVGTYSD
jgi:hypothetical protein